MVDYSSIPQTLSFLNYPRFEIATERLVDKFANKHIITTSPFAAYDTACYLHMYA